MSSEAERKEIYPKAVPDIEKWFYWNKGGRNIYVIGNKEIDKYFMAPENGVNMLHDLILHMDGTKSIAELESYAKETYHTIIPIDDLVKKLMRAGLLEGTDAERRNELDVFSKKLFSYKFKTFSLAKKKKLSHLWDVMVLLILALIVSALITLFLKPGECKTYYNQSFRFKDSYLYGAVISCFISIVNIICHEYAHAVSSVKFGLQPSEFAMILYGGYQFEWLVKIKGMYTVQRKYRILIMLAGVIANLALLSLSLLIGIWCPLSDIQTQLFSKFMVTNIFMIIACITPFSISDGYYVISQLFKTSNLRRQMFQMMNFKNRKKGQMKPFNLVYSLISIGMIFYSFAITIFWAVKVSAEVLEKSRQYIPSDILCYVPAMFPLLVVGAIEFLFIRRFIQLIHSNR